MPNPRNTAMISLLAVAIAGWAVIGLSTPHREAVPAQPISSAETVAPITWTMTAEEINQRLQLLAIAQPAEADPQTPAYERDEFGTRWADVDRNGCDTRNLQLTLFLPRSRAELPTIQREAGAGSA